MIYKNITPAEAMQLVLDGKQEKLYFRSEHTGALLPLSENNVELTRATGIEWLHECEEDFNRFSLLGAIGFTLKYLSHETSTTKLIDDIATDYIKTLKERKTSE